jgi:ABC-type multidrug transport system ATPase subunit
MEIQANNLGKRYRYEWIFKAFTAHFKAGECYAIKGSNGSGKSTLMQILSSQLSPSEGIITFLKEGKELKIGAVYKELSYTAPYIDLIEELTLLELLEFHWKFKPMQLSIKEALESFQFARGVRQKELKYFSSGMQQRVKLLLSIASSGGLLLLDEPTITLDTQGIDWYRNLLESHALNKPDRLVLIASNMEHDFIGPSASIDIRNFK